MHEFHKSVHTWVSEVGSCTSFTSQFIHEFQKSVHTWVSEVSSCTSFTSQFIHEFHKSVHTWVSQVWKSCGVLARPLPGLEMVWRNRLIPLESLEKLWHFAKVRNHGVTNLTSGPRWINWIGKQFNHFGCKVFLCLFFIQQILHGVTVPRKLFTFLDYLMFTFFLETCDVSQLLCSCDFRVLLFSVCVYTITISCVLSIRFPFVGILPVSVTNVHWIDRP